MSCLGSPGGMCRKGCCMDPPGKWSRPGAGALTDYKSEGREIAPRSETSPGPCACWKQWDIKGPVLLVGLWAWGRSQHPWQAPARCQNPHADIKQKSQCNR